MIYRYNKFTIPHESDIFCPTTKQYNAYFRVGCCVMTYITPHFSNYYGHAITLVSLISIKQALYGMLFTLLTISVEAACSIINSCSPIACIIVMSTDVEFICCPMLFALDPASKRSVALITY